MPFTATPLIAGDMYDMASRIARDADAALALNPDAAAQAACIGQLWAQVAELGWMATMVAEAQGGAGGTLGDVAALAGGAGCAALPLPIAAACAVVPHLLALVPGAPLLAEVAAGSARIAVILPGAAQDPGAAPLALADGVLRGGVVGVAMPPAPTHLLAVVGDALLLMPVDAPGLSLATSQRIDRCLTGDFTFAGVAATLLAEGPAVARQAEEARDLGALVTCVEATEAAGALIEQTIAYLSTRVQFGAPLGTNQALRHRVAEMYVEYETLRGLVGTALRHAEEDGRPRWRDVAFAKLRLGHAGRSIAEASIQCHGGMGMTDGLPATRLARRIMMAEHEYGDRFFQARRLLATEG